MKRSKVILKKGKEAIFKNRHQWIFSGAIESYPDDFDEGHIYPIFSFDKKLLGHGYFHSSLSLAGRILSFGDQDPWEAIYDHLDNAIALRAALFSHQETNAYRLVNGEGDYLPGLIIDQYGEYLVLQSNTLGMDLMKEKILDYLIQKKRWKSVFEKSISSSRKEEGLEDRVSLLWGKEIEEIPILENGLHFFADWKRGQKTGFFLDQREMRHLVKTISKDRTVLNCFSYTGGFSVYALAGGAISVTSVDSSKPALEMARKNLRANGFKEDQSPLIEADVFQFLREDPLDYEIAILDPPAFVKKKKDISQGINGYREINMQVLSKMAKGSFLLTSSCSYYIDETLFRTIIFQAAQSTNRDVQIVKESFHSVDHPISIFHPETRYLKNFLLYLPT
ncbi:MAG: class I SAM-dependent rRNA methyltransferase [Chlamydiae bacterium]|nr:class I SAM-dependent rRNA methyltransferase [Chlamydiota bacterium]